MSFSKDSKHDTKALLRIRERQLDVKSTELDNLRKYTQYLESTVPRAIPSAPRRSCSSNVTKASKKLTDDAIDLCDPDADTDADDMYTLHSGAPISKSNSRPFNQRLVAGVKPTELYHIRPIQLNSFDVPSGKILHDLWINHRCIARYFGGNRLRDRSGRTNDKAVSNMLFVNTRINIFVPQKAGEPGFLLYPFPRDKTWANIERLMVGEGHMSEHQYLGEYKLVDTKPTQLTAEEWGLLPPDRMWIWGLECVAFDFKFQEKLARAIRDGAKQDQLKNRITAGSKRKRAAYEEADPIVGFDRDD
ncbi:hypothetical protein DENSPDRAFT_930459 [Dentipellis sp. KUC8613]|nr:hypothetical protein DENSPDRAFT_930459 [Dentipellis sp. KUC8613]